MKSLVVFLFIILSMGNIRAQVDTFPYERDWATYFGGYNVIVQNGATDSQGNIYILSNVEANSIQDEVNAFTTANAYQTEYGGGAQDIFLFKFDPQGNLNWATFYGGEGIDTGNDIVIDELDNIYIVGQTDSEQGITTTGAYQETLLPLQPIAFPTMRAGFIAKFSSEGSLIWATYYDGELAENIDSVAILPNGFVITGETNSTTHIATPNSFKSSLNLLDPVYDLSGFIIKFNSQGERIWGTYYGPEEIGSGMWDVAADNQGNIYPIGTTVDASGYYATADAYQSQNSGNRDVYISKFSPEGNRIWSTYYGGTEYDVARGGIALRNEFYIVGSTRSTTNIATAGTHQENYIGPSNVGSNAFLVKFDPMTGNRIWGTYFGGAEENGGYAHLRLSGNPSSTGIWLSGTTSTSENIATPGAYQENVNPNSTITSGDGFFAKFDMTGNVLFGSYYGGEGGERFGRAIPLENDTFYFFGSTTSTTGIATADAYQPMLIGGNNPEIAFLAKFVPEGMGINDSSISQWNLWPNPTSGQFTIQGTNHGEIQLSLYDLNGREVFSQNNVKVGQPINLRGGLSAGMYFLKVKNGLQKTQVLKLIVK